MNRLSSIAQYLFFAMSMALLMLSSCSNENPAYNRENIKATWIVKYYNNQTLPLAMRDYTVITFDNSFGATHWGILSKGTGDYQWGSNALTYDVYCCDLAINGTYSGLYGYITPVTTHQEYIFSSVEDSVMTISNAVYQINQAYITPEFTDMTMEKITSKYASLDSLAGVWQFLERDGKEYNDYRIQFLSDGKLSLFKLSPDNQWVLMEGDNYFHKYDYFLPLTLWSNEEFGTVNHWDVKCFEIVECTPKMGTMTLTDHTSEYKLSFISSN